MRKTEGAERRGERGGRKYQEMHIDNLLTFYKQDLHYTLDMYVQAHTLTHTHTRTHKRKKSGWHNSLQGTVLHSTHSSLLRGLREERRGVQSGGES